MVVILGMPRSGSSMVAGAFAKHGCWTGRCRDPDTLNPTGYYENIDVKEYLIAHHGRLAQGTTPAGEDPGFMPWFETLKPLAPWAVKHSAMYWRVWKGVRFVGVVRDIDGCVASNIKTGFMGTKDPDKARAIYKAHIGQMMRAGAVPVFTDDVIAGDYSSLERALSLVVTPDRDIIDRHVDAEHWHHSRSTGE